jgi:hypothetical protein
MRADLSGNKRMGGLTSGSNFTLKNDSAPQILLRFWTDLRLGFEK